MFFQIRQSYDRTTKAQKVRYADYGSHKRKQDSSILKQVTVQARETFQRLERLESERKATEKSPDQMQQKGGKKRSSPNWTNGKDHSTSTLSSSHAGNPRQLFVPNDGNDQQQQQQQQQISSLPQQQQQQQRSLLSSVLEMSDGGSGGINGSAGGADATSIPTPSSTGAPPAQPPAGTTPMSSTTTTAGTPQLSNPKPKCLTQLKEPLSKDGLDNAEGNLIVTEGDLIQSDNVHELFDNARTNTPVRTSTTTTERSQQHGHSSLSSSMSSSRRFRVIGLLGQGTFAQVFLCEDLHDDKKRRVALKVVKNKPAYTRQATVEIDVFRTLSKSSQNMVQLECYFMFRNHLCLVFELLGLNLYEVLKRRQFRGVPLTSVQQILRQALEGIQELSQKNIVHCDLKPENILLSDREDVTGLLSAGALRTASAISKKQQSSSQENGNKKKEEQSEEGEQQQSESAKLASSSSTTGAAATKEKKKSKAKKSATSKSDKQTDGSHCTEGMGNTPTTEDTGTVTNASSKQSKSLSDSTGTSFASTSTKEAGMATKDAQSSPPPPIDIKLIDFGSACFEGNTVHTYIQSRFYRSPEVMIGLPYDSAIDMWSLGCVTAELFLGLPILPGVHEHDQLGRITEMIGPLPEWMLDQG